MQSYRIAMSFVRFSDGIDVHEIMKYTVMT